MSGNNREHAKAIEKIANHPAKFGFFNVLTTSLETRLYHQGTPLTVTDIIFELRSRDIHIVEYKGVGNGELLEIARKQLENARWWYGHYKPEIPPEKIHTHIISGDDPRYKGLLREL